MNWPFSVLKHLIIATIVLGAAELQMAKTYAGSSFFLQTLTYHLSTNAVAHAKGHSPEDMSELSKWGYAIYSETNLGHLTNAVWSTNCWLHGVQGLSATPIGYSNGMGGQGLITMVSPRHYLFATHMHPEGYAIVFLDTNNVVCWRKTLERADITNDISVGILNADLPPSVEYLPVIPTNFASYIPANNSTTIQGIGMNQDMKLFGQPMNFGNAAFVCWKSSVPVPFGLGTNWNVEIRGGDSSNPEMLLIGTQLVLVSHNYGINAGPNYATEIPAINEKMHYLSIHNDAKTDYQLTQFSLKNWPVVQ